MKKIDFKVENQNWTKAVRNIRIDGISFEKEVGDYIENISCHFENGHEISKHFNGNIIWQSTTMVYDKNNNILVKECGFHFLIDSKLDFINGSINNFALGWKSINNNEYLDLLPEIQRIIKTCDYWDFVEEGELTDVLGSYPKNEMDEFFNK